MICHRSSVSLLVSVSLLTIANCLLPFSAAAKRQSAKIAYIPGITLAPEVLQADGVTPRTYTTPQGPVLWNENLPIQQGDQIKLNVFVATGGSNLQDVKVRLDNTLIANIQASPWNTVINTAPLALGYHMVEVWAQSTGTPPESSSKQLLFDVVKPLPALATTEVKPSDQVYNNGTISPATLSGNDLPPALPTFLAGQPTDPNANVNLDYKDASLPPLAPSSLIGTSPVVVAAPTLFSVQSEAGSDAQQYAYALVRDGVTILASAAPIRLDNPNVHTVIKIQKRTPTQPGLRTGSVVMWVWGVDAQGHPGNPVKALLQIP